MSHLILITPKGLERSLGVPADWLRRFSMEFFKSKILLEKTHGLGLVHKKLSFSLSFFDYEPTQTLFQRQNCQNLLLLIWTTWEEEMWRGQANHIDTAVPSWHLEAPSLSQQAGKNRVTKWTKIHPLNFTSLGDSSHSEAEVQHGGETQLSDGQPLAVQTYGLAVTTVMNISGRRYVLG